jgi:hypothetical protein
MFRWVAHHHHHGHSVHDDDNEHVGHYKWNFEINQLCIVLELVTYVSQWITNTEWKMLKLILLFYLRYLFKIHVPCSAVRSTRTLHILIVILSVRLPCGLVDWHLYPYEGDSMFFRNVGSEIRAYMRSSSRTTIWMLPNVMKWSPTVCIHVIVYTPANLLPCAYVTVSLHTN